MGARRAVREEAKSLDVVRREAIVMVESERRLKDRRVEGCNGPQQQEHSDPDVELN